MSIFAVLSEGDNPTLAQIIEQKYSGNHYRIGPRNWILASKETVRQVSDTLGITTEEGQKKGPTGSAIILAITNYWGIADPNIWEWIKSKMEEGNA